MRIIIRIYATLSYGMYITAQYIYARGMEEWDVELEELQKEKEKVKSS